MQKDGTYSVIPRMAGGDNASSKRSGYDVAAEPLETRALDRGQRNVSGAVRTKTERGDLEGVDST